MELAVLRDGWRCEMATAMNRIDTEELTHRFSGGLREAKATVSAKLEEGKTNVDRLVKRSCRALEDGIEETAHRVKRNPLSSVAIAFGAGLSVGALVLGAALAKKTSHNGSAA